MSATHFCRSEKRPPQCEHMGYGAWIEAEQQHYAYHRHRAKDGAFIENAYGPGGDCMWKSPDLPVANSVTP